MSPSLILIDPPVDYSATHKIEFTQSGRHLPPLQWRLFKARILIVRQFGILLPDDA